MSEYELEQEARRRCLDYYLRLADALEEAGNIAHEGSKYGTELGVALWQEAMLALDCAQEVSKGLVIEDKSV